MLDVAWIYQLNASLAIGDIIIYECRSVIQFEEKQNILIVLKVENI